MNVSSIKLVWGGRSYKSLLSVIGFMRYDET